MLAPGCAVPDDRSEVGQAIAEIATTFALTVTTLSTPGEGVLVVAPPLQDVFCNGVCHCTIPAGTVVTLSVDPVDNVLCKQFTGWTGVCLGKGATCQFVMTGDLSATARWGRLPGCTPP
jgi:uncharacterized repeat protein (TIGR02543 family)